MRAPIGIPSVSVAVDHDGELSANRNPVQRHLSGDPMASREIVETYLPTVFKIAMRLSGQREDAEDLTQDVFMKVFENLPKLRSDEQLEGWIYTIARNHVCKEIGRRQRQRKVIACQNREAEQLAPVINQAGPEDCYLSKEDQEDMTRALGALEPLHLQILTLCDIDEMSYSDIASMLGVPIGTVRSRLFRARNALAAALASPNPGSNHSGGHR